MLTVVSSLKMAAVSGIRAHLCLCRSVLLQQTFRLNAPPLTRHLPRRLCFVASEGDKPKAAVNTEKECLLEKLNLMGVDVKKAQQRQPGVFRKSSTNEQGVAQFLQSKGASQEVIAGIISRYPRAITRTIDNLEQRWQLWRKMLNTDEEIVNILDRAPEGFFRSSDNNNFEKNIAFLTGLGLDSKVLKRMLSTAPRTFSNSVELNKQMVECLQDACSELGGENPQQFAKNVISKNVYILIRSTKRVKTNIDILRDILEISDSQLLDLFQGPGAIFLDLSNDYMKNNFVYLQKKMASLGCGQAQVRQLVITYPTTLYIGCDTLSLKLDCLLEGGITIQQILEKPTILNYSIQNITGRFKQLQSIKYDFQKNGIGVLMSSQKRFDARMKRLIASVRGCT